jgi:hypothetical protein
MKKILAFTMGYAIGTLAARGYIRLGHDIRTNWSDWYNGMPDED